MTVILHNELEIMFFHINHSLKKTNKQKLFGKKHEVEF